MLTSEQAKELYATGWWKDLTPREIVKFQLFEPMLCMPWGEFCTALNNALGRGVMTHELGMNLEGIQKEFLGEAPPPTLEDIINLIPAAKRIVVKV